MLGISEAELLEYIYEGKVDDADNDVFVRTLVGLHDDCKVGSSQDGVNTSATNVIPVASSFIMLKPCVKNVRSRLNVNSVSHLFGARSIFQSLFCCQRVSYKSQLSGKMWNSYY